MTLRYNVQVEWPNTGWRTVKAFPTKQAAVSYAKREAAKPGATFYRVQWDQPRTSTRRSPSTSVKRAARRLQAFSGHPVRSVRTVKIPTPRALLAVGDLVGVIYRTLRDGKVVDFEHRFRKNSRPLLSVADDGKQIVVSGGSFTFTSRGFVDRGK